MEAQSDKQANGSVRMTPQREAVLTALAHTHSHPTARELHTLARRHLPGISLATVYNSLESLERAGMVNRHSLSSGPARYCINATPHAHVLDTATGHMLDVQLKPGIKPEDVFDLPAGVKVTAMNAYLLASFSTSTP